MSIPVGGGVPVTLISGQRGVNGIAMDFRDAYWTSHEGTAGESGAARKRISPRTASRFDRFHAKLTNPLDRCHAHTSAPFLRFRDAARYCRGKDCPVPRKSWKMTRTST